MGIISSGGDGVGGKDGSKNRKVFSIRGDGELQEGSIWEAAMSASHHKLDKLVGVVDRNFVQIDGRTSEVMEVDPLADKWASYGWKVFECDGHNIVALCNAFELAEKVEGKPSVIIAKTKMGKGIKPIEDDFR